LVVPPTLPELASFNTNNTGKIPTPPSLLLLPSPTTTTTTAAAAVATTTTCHSGYIFFTASLK
jgi:hypothetical protein